MNISKENGSVRIATPDSYGREQLAYSSSVTDLLLYEIMQQLIASNTLAQDTIVRLRSIENEVSHDTN